MMQAYLRYRPSRFAVERNQDGSPRRIVASFWPAPIRVRRCRSGFGPDPAMVAGCWYWVCQRCVVSGWCPSWTGALEGGLQHLKEEHSIGLRVEVEV